MRWSDHGHDLYTEGELRSALIKGMIIGGVMMAVGVIIGAVIVAVSL